MNRPVTSSFRLRFHHVVIAVVAIAVAVAMALNYYIW
jgi:hypothetical protein